MCRENAFETCNKDIPDTLILREISRVINSNLGLRDIYRVVFEYLSQLLDFDLGGYYLKDIKNLRLEETLNLEKKYISVLGEHSSINILVKKVDATQRPWICSHFMGIARMKKHPFYSEILKPNGIFYTMGAPVIANGILIGSINLGRSRNKGDFSPEELSKLELVANMLSAVVRGYSRTIYYGDIDCMQEQAETGIDNNDYSHWMKMLGNISIIVARELRNPLVNMKMAFYSMARSIKIDSAMQPDMEQMEHSLQRMNKTIDLLQSLSCDLELNFVKVDINRLLDEVLEIIRPTIDPEVIIIKDYAFVPLVNADREKMMTVFINIIENAIDAMPAGGMIQIKTFGNDEKVRIILEDDGLGIENYLRQHLFDPFISAKNNGAGLGLAVCKRIIECHGGQIDIRSKIDEGTAVRIDIPVNN